MAERSHQVAQMREIFYHADKVVVWLGDGDMESDLAMDYLRYVSAGAEIHDNFLLQYPKRSHPGNEVAASIKTYAYTELFLQLVDDLRAGQTLDWKQAFALSLVMEATDERDLIYAVLGLLRTPSSPNNAITPDYSKDLTTVHCEATACVIREEQNLDSLSFTASKLDTELPSWVPNATDGTQGMFLDTSIHLYTAAGSTEPCVYWTGDHKVLNIQGVVIDTVAEVVAVQAKGALTNAKQVAYSTGQLNGLSVGDTKDRFWRTVTGNQGRRYDTTDIIYPASECYDIRYMVAQDEMEMPSELVGDGVAFEWQLHFIRPFYASFDAFNGQGQANFFTTESGRFGIGQTGVAPGDLLCILSGGRVVYILRENAGHQRLVGCAYLHGVMDGELSSQLNDEKVVRNFEIH
ncbi:hypothetical protein LTR56_016235 [Elasticomyces elasticus]|nr:hypothetical protein LTR56_016235 [Elasticomyces elasticus]KAK3636077.1 hypothetical protein LTR22_018924 [Elasticomyces elasticus]KAK4912310.1 hypothetical protein LTR49_019218 [Elasticomyces elasticus]KAK5751383.1 hypothetical protein LTS12_018541 [Elasticomyces elasticus]